MKYVTLRVLVFHIRGTVSWRSSHTTRICRVPGLAKIRFRPKPNHHLSRRIMTDPSEDVRACCADTRSPTAILSSPCVLPGDRNQYPLKMAVDFTRLRVRQCSLELLRFKSGLVGMARQCGGLRTRFNSLRRLFALMQCISMY